MAKRTTENELNTQALGDLEVDKNRRSLETQLSDFKAYEIKKGQFRLANAEEYAKVERRLLEERYATEEDLAQARLDGDKELEEEILARRKQVAKDVANYMALLDTQRLQRLSASELSERNKKREEELQELQKKLDIEIQFRQKIARRETGEAKASTNKAIEEYKNQQKAIQAELASLKIAKEREWNQANRKQRLQIVAEEKTEALRKYKDLTDKEKALQREKKRLKAEGKDTSEVDKELTDIQAQKIALPAVSQNRAIDAIAKFSTDNKEALKALGGTLEKIGSKIDGNFNTYYQYQSRIIARLEGSTKDYNEMVKTIRDNLAVSPYVTQKKLIENLNKLSDAGVAYNIEQRAFLASISEKIATTFNAFDANLLRLIRIQQADSTSARLGMENVLTNFLNSMFEDTSYLSETFDNVASALLEASALMTEKQSTEFEYMVQKWLGALGSIGFNSTTLQQIATGIGYIGSGNISALASNSGLQSLLAMSSSKAGLDYSELLVKGLDSSNTNKLLEAMVGYLQEIAGNNNVVKAQYSELYNLTVSDLKAVQTLTAKDIKNIANSALSYNQAVNQTVSQLESVGKRMNVGEMIENVAENFFTNIATEISSSTPMYTAWLINDFIEDATGGINIPAVLGNDINANINQIAKLGMVGVSTLGGMGEVIRSVGATANFGDLSKWGGTTYTSRGTGAFTSAGISEGTSKSMQIASSSSSDILAGYNADIDKQLDEAQNKSEKKGLFSKIGGLFTKNSDSSESSATEAGDLTSIYNLLNNKLNSTIPVRITQVDDRVTMSTKVASLDEAIKTYLRNMLNQNVTSTNNYSVTNDTNEKLDSLIEKILDGTVNVNITNDIIEQALMKYMYMGGGN